MVKSEKKDENRESRKGREGRESKIRERERAGLRKRKIQRKHRIRNQG